MKPVYFKDHNDVYARNQPEYLPLPVYRHGDSWKCVTSCWGMGFIERVRVLLTGKIYVTAATFGKPLTPISLHLSLIKDPK